MTADQWRRLEALEQSCLGCLNEDIHDAEHQRDEFEITKRLSARLDEFHVKHGKERRQPSEEERAEDEEDGRLRTEQAITLKQLELQRRRLLNTVRKTRLRPSCPRCTPRRRSRERMAQFAARLVQTRRDRAADDERWGPDGKVLQERPTAANSGHDKTSR